MKYRIVETEDGQFCPQFKEGWLYRWEFFDARTVEKMSDGWMFLASILQKDPDKIARFSDYAEAEGFIKSVKDISAQYWQEREHRKERERTGVKVRAAHKVD